MTEHLSDEELTDVVDDGAAPVVDAHLGACAACRARLAAVRAAAALVASRPPAPDEAQRRAAIERAMEASGRRRQSAPAPWMLAAATVAVLVAIGGAFIAGRDSDDSQTALRNSVRESQDLESAQTGPVDGGDLGNLRDATSLHAALAARLGAAGGGTAAAGGAATGSDEAAEEAPVAVARDSASKAAGGAAPPAAQVCLTEARALGSGRVGALIYTARLRWQGEPAVVVVFAAPEQTQLDRRAFVMARRGCRLLVAQSF